MQRGMVRLSVSCITYRIAYISMDRKVPKSLFIIIYNKPHEDETTIISEEMIVDENEAYMLPFPKEREAWLKIRKELLETERIFRVATRSKARQFKQMRNILLQCNGDLNLFYKQYCFKNKQGELYYAGI